MLKKAIIFVAGVGVGSLVTWKVLETKYEQLVQKELESVREVYGRKREETGVSENTKNDDTETSSNDNAKHDIMSYQRIIEQTNYNACSEREDKAEMESPKEKLDKPYVITPDQFDYEDDYEKISLTYYADGTLADDMDEMVDPDECIGRDSLTHFGEYEEDTVYVRNDKLRADYEVQKDVRNYLDVVGEDYGG